MITRRGKRAHEKIRNSLKLSLKCLFNHSDTIKIRQRYSTTVSSELYTKTVIILGRLNDRAQEK